MPTPEHHTMNAAGLIAVASTFLLSQPWGIICAGAFGSVLGVALAGSLPLRTGIGFLFGGTIFGYYAHYLLVDLRIQNAWFHYDGISYKAAIGAVFLLVAVFVTFHQSILKVIKSRIESFEVRK